jgi:hypothetical protein
MGNNVSFEYIQEQVDYQEKWIMLRKKRWDEIGEMLNIIPEYLHKYTFNVLPEFRSDSQFRRKKTHFYRYQQSIMSLIRPSVEGRPYDYILLMLMDISRDLQVAKMFLVNCGVAFNERNNRSTSTGDKLRLINDGLTVMVEMIRPSLL